MSDGAGTPDWGRAEPAGGLRAASGELLTVKCLKGGEGEGLGGVDGKSLISLKLGCPDPLESPSLVKMPAKVGEEEPLTDEGVG